MGTSNRKIRMEQANRREFLRWSATSTVALLGIPKLPLRAGIARGLSTGLVDNGDISLPPGFRYVKFSAWGDPMSDGNLTPFLHDGMASFPGSFGNILLVRNHEIGDG